MQYGVIFNEIDKNKTTPLGYWSSILDINQGGKKIIWLLGVLDQLFNSQNLMQDLNEQLVGKSRCWGPYGAGHPDTWTSNNPMLFILNARNIQGKTLLHIAADTNDIKDINILLEFNHGYLESKLNARYITSMIMQMIISLYQ